SLNSGCGESCMDAESSDGGSVDIERTARKGRTLFHPGKTVPSRETARLGRTSWSCGILNDEFNAVSVSFDNRVDIDRSVAVMQGIGQGLLHDAIGGDLPACGQIRGRTDERVPHRQPCRA